MLVIVIFWKQKLFKQVIWAKLTKHATALAVPVHRLSSSISSHFIAIRLWSVHCSRKSQKNTKTSYFEGSRSFKDIDVNLLDLILDLMPWRRWWISALRQLQLHDYKSGFSKMSCFEQVCQPQVRIGAVHRCLLLCCPSIFSVFYL